MKIKFTDEQLETLQVIHDKKGPRATYAFYLYLNKKNYKRGTEDLNTNEVEDFIIMYYTQYNARFGQRY